jgi:hypothetical protein
VAAGFGNKNFFIIGSGTAKTFAEPHTYKFQDVRANAIQLVTQYPYQQLSIFELLA